MLWVFIAIIIVAVVAFLFYVFPFIQVCGDSMYPTFHNGDIILGCRLFSFKIGVVYVFTPPIPPTEEGGYVIKRLTHISPQTGKLFFKGDNADHSYDSRMYGYVSREKVIAKYLFTIHRRKECSNNERN